MASEAIVYPIISRPLLDHIWENEIITIYKNTDLGNLVKVTIFIENHGNSIAENVIVEAGFFNLADYKVASQRQTITSLEPGMKEKVILSVNIPVGIETSFKTKLIMDGEVVDTRESVDTFE